MTTYVHRFYEKAREDGLSSAFYRLYQWFSYKSKLFRKLKMRFLYKPIGLRSVRRSVNGSEMILDANDAGISYQLASNGILERVSTHRFEKMLTEMKDQFDSSIHVFDVGANIGYYMLLEALILGEQGKIYAVEAEPSNVGFCIETCA